MQESTEEAADHFTAPASAAEATKLLEPTATKAEPPREDAVRKAGALVALPARIASKTEHLGGRRRAQGRRPARAALGVPGHTLRAGRLICFCQISLGIFEFD